MAVPRNSEEIPPNLARLLERGKREIEEAQRELGGDPDEAFDDFVRKNYDLESLQKILHEMIEEGPGWLDDDVDESAVD